MNFTEREEINVKILFIDNTAYTASEAVKEGSRLNVKIPVTSLTEFNTICQDITAENIGTVRIATDENVVYGIHTCINHASANIDDVNFPTEVQIEFSYSSEIEQNIASLQNQIDEIITDVIPGVIELV